ncbi:dentin sialophosphoprotein, partial [Vibrio astriarenae]
INTADSYNTLQMDSDTVVATSEVMGSVSSTSVNYSTMEKDSTVRVDNVNNLGGMDGASGITTVAQSAGGNALIQQSVATNASV